MGSARPQMFLSVYARKFISNRRRTLYLRCFVCSPSRQAGCSRWQLEHLFAVTTLGTMPTPTIQYHCNCTSLSGGVPPPPHLASSSYAFHSLHSLYFCEECDAVRCNRCVTMEVSGYYCPNCLFEVPSASVRAEKNRSACHGHIKLL